MENRLHTCPRYRPQRRARSELPSGAGAARGRGPRSNLSKSHSPPGGSGFHHRPTLCSVGSSHGTDPGCACSTSQGPGSSAAALRTCLLTGASRCPLHPGLQSLPGSNASAPCPVSRDFLKLPGGSPSAAPNGSFHPFLHQPTQWVLRGRG